MRLEALDKLISGYLMANQAAQVPTLLDSVSRQFTSPESIAALKILAARAADRQLKQQEYDAMLASQQKQRTNRLRMIELQDRLARAQAAQDQESITRYQQLLDQMK